MDKEKQINLLFDGTILKAYSKNNSDRSGIFFTADNIIKELVKHKEFRIAVYSDILGFFNVKNYLNDNLGEYNLPLYTDSVFQNLVYKYSEIQERRKELKNKKRPLKRFLLKIILFFLGVLLKVSNPIGQILSKKNMKKSSKSLGLQG